MYAGQAYKKVVCVRALACFDGMHADLPPARTAVHKELTAASWWLRMHAPLQI
jgi:hypothetical protein